VPNRALCYILSLQPYGYREYQITSLLDRIYAILNVTQYDFITSRALGLPSSLCSLQARFGCIKTTHDHCSVQNVFMNSS